MSKNAKNALSLWSHYHSAVYIFATKKWPISEKFDPKTLNITFIVPYTGRGDDDQIDHSHPTTTPYENISSHPILWWNYYRLLEALEKLARKPLVAAVPVADEIESWENPLVLEVMLVIDPLQEKA